MEILHSYLKEFSPKPSAGIVSVFMCCNVSSPFVQIELTFQPTFQRMWTDLTLSCFVLKLTNVYDNTNELSSVQKCAFQIPQRQFFCILIIFSLIFLVFS